MGVRRGSQRGRWWSRRQQPTAPPLDPSRTDLVVVASSFDDAEAASAVLARAVETEPRWRPEEPALLRHHLVLPAEHVADAVAVAGQDGYRETERAAAPYPAGTPAVPGGRLVLLERVQSLDALTLSQERSRMAGLAQRRDGAALGWQALQPPG